MKQHNFEQDVLDFLEWLLRELYPTDDDIVEAGKKLGYAKTTSIQARTMQRGLLKMICLALYGLGMHPSKTPSLIPKYRKLFKDSGRLQEIELLFNSVRSKYGDSQVFDWLKLFDQWKILRNEVKKFENREESDTD